MKIIFLDFDGVIITYRSHFARRFYNDKKWGNVDVTASMFLLNICKHSNEEVRIVVSSSWRVDEQRCISLLRNVGLDIYLHNDWRTEINYYEISGNKEYVRGDEIQHWLNQHRDIISYKILDDDSDMLPEQKEHHIHCCMMDGISGENMKKLMNWVGL